MYLPENNDDENGLLTCNKSNLPDLLFLFDTLDILLMIVVSLWDNQAKTFFLPILTKNQMNQGKIKNYHSKLFVWK